MPQMGNWQSIYKDDREHRVHIVKAVLEDAGMHPIKVDNRVSQHGFGYFEIFVAPNNILKAIKIIKEEIKFG